MLMWGGRPRPPLLTVIATWPQQEPCGDSRLGCPAARSDAESQNGGAVAPDGGAGLPGLRQKATMNRRALAPEGALSAAEPRVPPIRTNQ
jgi:hypothetical protein